MKQISTLITCGAPVFLADSYAEAGAAAELCAGEHVERYTHAAVNAAYGRIRSPRVIIMNTQNFEVCNVEHGKPAAPVAVFFFRGAAMPQGEVQA